jgi:hypothetical protein
MDREKLRSTKILLKILGIVLFVNFPYYSKSRKKLVFHF